MFNFLRSKSNINRVADLESVDIGLCGSTIFLQQKLPKHLIVKLKEIIGKVAITRLVLRDCFEDASQLVGVLQALEENSNVKSLHLDLRDNPHDMECAREICKLTRREIFQSLALPEGMEEECTAEILHEINNTKAQLTELDLSESVLNEDSLKYLSEILKHRKVYEKLVLKGCVGVANTTLTTKDLEKLQEAEKTGRRRGFWGDGKKVKIVEFNHVLHISEQDLDHSEYEIEAVEEKIRPFFKGKLGKVEKVVRYIARNKKGGPLRLLRTGRKRPAEEKMEAASKVPKNEEVDALSALFGKMGDNPCTNAMPDGGNNFFTNNVNPSADQNPNYAPSAPRFIPCYDDGSPVDGHGHFNGHPLSGSPPPRYQCQPPPRHHRSNNRGRYDSNSNWQNPGVRTRSQRGRGNSYQFSSPVDRNLNNQYNFSNGPNLLASSPTSVIVQNLFSTGIDVPDSGTTENNGPSPEHRYPDIKREFDEGVVARQPQSGNRRPSDFHRQDQPRYVPPKQRMATRSSTGNHNQQNSRSGNFTNARDEGFQKNRSKNNVGSEYHNSQRNRSRGRGGKTWNGKGNRWRNINQELSGN